VLLVEHAGRRILLPADLDAHGLEDLLAREPIPCDIAMAPHHGSMRSDPQRFAAWCTPQWVVICGGHEDVDPRVNGVFTAAGAQVHNTAIDGAVHAVISGSDVRVQSWLADGW
jgi:competence protein ComEC